jgi:hypothetical protein
MHAADGGTWIVFGLSRALGSFPFSAFTLPNRNYRKPLARNERGRPWVFYVE